MNIELFSKIKNDNHYYNAIAIELAKFFKIKLNRPINNIYNKGIVINNDVFIDFGDYHKRTLHIINHFRIILKCQYDKQIYEIFSNVKPFTYFPFHPIIYENNLIELCKSVRSDKLIWHGVNTAHRIRILKKLSDIVVVNMRHNIDDLSWLREHSTCKIGLSLPGNGDFCHRDIEYFGMGIPVLRPRFKNSFFNPIPENFYIPTDYTAESIRNEYLKIKNDQKILNKISNNCQQWYIKNCTIKSAIAMIQTYL